MTPRARTAALARTSATAARAFLIDAGDTATFAAEEFFAARLRNPHTRRAYARPVRIFLCWAADAGRRLDQITPADAGLWLDLYGENRAIATQKLALTALRQFFDTLVARRAIPLNPFSSVRPPRSDAREGKTPEISVPQVRHLLASLDTTVAPGLRDRALLGTLAYTGARAGAVAALRLQDVRDYGAHRTILFREKRGKTREVPVRIDLDSWLTAYRSAAHNPDDPSDAPFWRVLTPTSPTGFGPAGIGPWTLRAMLKRRLKDAGLPTLFTVHSFRVLVVSDLLDQDVPLEDVQYLVGHSHPSTTQLYDRRTRAISRNIVERISV